MYPSRRACIYVALALCTIGGTAAQEDKSRTAPPAAGQPAFGLGTGGGPTPAKARGITGGYAGGSAVQRLVGRRPDHRADQRRQRRARRHGIYENRYRLPRAKSSLSSTPIVMPPRIVAWRPVLGCVQLPIGATEDALKYVPQVAANVMRPDFDTQDWPTGRSESGRPFAGREAESA